MDKEKIERINFLAKKARNEILTEEEKIEQKTLRDEYRAGFMKSFIQELDNTYIVDEFGNKKPIIKK